MKNEMNFLVGFIVCGILTIVGCHSPVESEKDIHYPKTIMNDPDLGRVVAINDSIIVVYNRIGMSSSESKVVNINTLK